jgi:threonine aldolase
MFKAVVGDDVYKQDPTVIELEAKVAAMFGMEAFFPFWNNGQSNCDKITYTTRGTIMINMYIIMKVEELHLIAVFPAVY